MGGDGRFILSRRCVGVTPHLRISSVRKSDPSSSDPALIKARGKKWIRVTEPPIVKQNNVALGTRTQPM